MLQLSKTAFLCISAVALGIVSNYRYDQEQSENTFALQGFVDDAWTEFEAQEKLIVEQTEVFWDSCAAGQETLECLLAWCDTVTDMVKSDCEALVALYTATNGAKRTQSANWLNTNKACSRFGVACNSNKRVVYLRLQSNNLNGPLPKELGNLTELIQLNMSNNSLRWTLPDTLWNLTKVQRFLLNDNSLSGKIPTTFWALAWVKWFWLFNNDLAWSLPKELGNLWQAQEILLSNNFLSGYPPQDLWKLSNLKKLWLDWNAFTGPIPIFLTSLTQLQDLDISHNQFCGYLPTSFVTTRPNGLPFTYDWSINKLIPKGNTNALQTRITKNNIQFGNQTSEKCPLTQEQQLPDKGIN